MCAIPIRCAARQAGPRLSLIWSGILHKSGAQTFQSVHVAGARAAAKAAREAGARMFVHVSAIGADRKSWSKYSRTKAAGEAAVLAEFPEAVILRPSLMFGPEDQLFNRFAAMARMSPFLPLVGGGKTRFQPVYVGDVAAAISTACAGKAKKRTIYELGGPDVVTFRQILDLTQQWSGHKRWYLRLPFWLAQIGAFLTVPLPNNLRPLTVDQVRALAELQCRHRECSYRGAYAEQGLAWSTLTRWRQSCRRTWSASSRTASSLTTAAERGGLMSSAVINNANKNRFELETSAGLAVADYRLDAGVMMIYHTEVPVPLRGRGIGGRLVEGALNEARKLTLKVVPNCWFVREFIERNPQFRDLLE